MQGHDAPTPDNPPALPDDLLRQLLDAVTLLGQRLTVVERQIAVMDDEISTMARRLKPEDANT